MFYYALKFPDLVVPMVFRFGQKHFQSWLISATKPMLTPQCSQRVLRAITFESLNQIFSGRALFWLQLKILFVLIKCLS